MRVEWKIVTDNPHVTRKLKEFANVLRMQHQPEACTSELGDGSHITFEIFSGEFPLAKIKLF